MFSEIPQVVTNVQRLTDDSPKYDQEDGGTHTDPDGPGGVPHGWQEQGQAHPDQEADQRTSINVRDRPPGLAEGIALAARPTVPLHIAWPGFAFSWPPGHGRLTGGHADGEVFPVHRS